MNPSGRPDWQERVIAEEADLSARMARLADFLNDKANMSMPARDRELLSLQHAAMAGYATILRQRIARFTPTPTPTTPAAKGELP